MEDEVVENEPLERALNQLTPVVFDCKNGSLEIPANFNSVKITLEGFFDGDLNWKKQIELARAYVDKGLYVFWQLDLGLFNHLQYPLAHQTQYLSIGLAVEHFRDTVLEQFSDQTIGVCLYSGNADFTEGFKWEQTQTFNFQDWLKEAFQTIDTFNREIGLKATGFEDIQPADLMQNNHGQFLLNLFCRDVSIDYLDLLSSRVPSYIPIYLLIENTHFDNSYEKAIILSKERFERYRLNLDASPLTESQIGICMPARNTLFPSINAELEQVSKRISDSNKPLRFISEALITQSWDGLDYLIYSPQGLGTQGKRKLLGFCAAGGTVVSTGELLGLPNEMALDDFTELLKQL